ncbi:MAG: ATP-binding cassette domain-containing protein [Candidatus Kappaea frigidicola]|nr:ATP-binding cassette domain-containing protein [Candidatus Kappaea frigidicola]
MSVLTLKNISLTLSDKKILHNVNLEFLPGKIHALVGPNGAGKSSLAFTIMGLEGYRKFEGDIIFKGESLKDKSIDQRAKLGITLAWQEPARYEGLTISSFLEAAYSPEKGFKPEEALLKSGLAPDLYLKRAVDKTLSGGERKKVELASILAMMPQVVLLDEPDSGIDIESLERIFDAIKILKKRGSTVILITHSLKVLEHAEDAFLLCCGHLMEKGSGHSMCRYFKGKCMPCDHQNMPEADDAK